MGSQIKEGHGIEIKNGWHDWIRQHFVNNRWELGDVNWLRGLL
jgi:hypothetical protein